MTRRVVTSINMVATVMKTQAMIVTIFPLNFALTEIQTDIIMLRNTTTVEAPTLAASEADSMSFPIISFWNEAKKRERSVDV